MLRDLSLYTPVWTHFLSCFFLHLHWPSWKALKGSQHTACSWHSWILWSPLLNNVSFVDPGFSSVSLYQTSLRWTPCLSGDVFHSLEPLWPLVFYFPDRKPQLQSSVTVKVSLQNSWRLWLRNYEKNVTEQMLDVPGQKYF